MIGEVEDFQVGNNVDRASAKMLFDAQIESIEDWQTNAVLLPEDRLVLTSRRVQVAANHGCSRHSGGQAKSRAHDKAPGGCTAHEGEDMGLILVE